MENMNSETGIHFGVIPQNSLREWAYEDIINNGTDLDFEDYLENFREILTSALNLEFFEPETIRGALEPMKKDFDECQIENIISACENDGPDCLRSAISEFELDAGEYAPENSGDCTRYLYEKDGLKFQVCGDGDIFVLESPYVTLSAFCSPCAPNAGYLLNPGSVPCYCMPPEWFDENTPVPYLYMKTAEYLKTGEFVPENEISEETE